MKKYGIRVFITAIIQVVFAGGMFAQSNSQTNTPATLALATSKVNYNTQIGWQSRLYNGVKYVDYEAGYTGSAYFLNSNFQNASLLYDGTHFYDVPILYDLYKEAVIVKYPADSGLMSLINDKLDRFLVTGHTFIRVDADNSPKSLKGGFYELLYDGRSQFIKKYTKDIQEEKSGINIQHVFYEHTAYYLLKDNVYNPVSGKRSLLNLFKDKKKEIDDYIKSNKIDFSDNEEQAMVKVITYYDQLSK